MPKFLKSWLQFSFIRNAAFIIIFLLTSCVTRALWDETYKESFRNFLVSENGDHVVFLGKNYHYVFNDNSSLMDELLAWKYSGLLFINIEESYIKVDLANDVSGYVIIETFNNDLMREDENFLRALGFRYNEEKYSLQIKVKLSGKRYLPSAEFQGHGDKLRRTYIADIHQSAGFFKTAAKVAITPITLTADSLYVIGEIALMPFKAPFRN